MRASRKGTKLGRRTVNKSELIRVVARNMVAQGHPPRPVEIVETLAKQGVKVTSGQVSLAVKDTNLALRPRTTAVRLPDPGEALRRVGVEELTMARELARRLGSIEKALDAVVALSQLGEKIQKEEPQGEEP